MSKIRELRSCEYGLLDEFLYQTIFTAPDEPRPPRTVTRAPELRAYIEGFGSRAGDAAVCAEADGRVVGAAWARLMRGYGFAGDGVPELAVSVLPGYRGRGIGTVLIEGLAARCAELGYPALSLSVQRANPAVRLYGRIGFREVAGDDAEAVMVLPLQQPSNIAVSDVPFDAARAVAMRILAAPALQGRTFLEGGLVPWIASGRDSGRFHGDVDISVRLGDMPLVRSWLRGEGAYDPALDSLNLPCNDGFGDFGVHALIDGVLASFCPFAFADGGRHQRNAALGATDGFDALLEATLSDVSEVDLVEMRRLPDGTAIGCATLESVRAAKVASGRAKDARDVAEIDRIGFDAGRYRRIEPAYASMHIACVVHEGQVRRTGAGDFSHKGQGDPRDLSRASPFEEFLISGCPGPMSTL